jgi:hypothetical protein
MKAKKSESSQKTHPIDYARSIKFQTKQAIKKTRKDRLTNKVDLNFHINPHAYFSPRTTLDQGRGK